MRRPLALALAVLAVATMDCRGREAKLKDSAEALIAAALVMPTFTTPSCDSVPGVLCFADTAVEYAVDYEPGSRTDADWIVFVSAGDSIVFGVDDGDDDPWKWQSVDFIVPRSMGGDTTNLGKNFARWFRAPWNGAAHLTLDLEQYGFRDTVPYVVRIRPFAKEAPPALRPSGRMATINILSKSDGAHFSIIPLSVAKPASREHWTMFARHPRVTLVQDSLYEICGVPCVKPDTILLRPNARVDWRP